MKCDECEWYRNDICHRAEHLSEWDIDCFQKVIIILLRDILDQLYCEAEEGEDDQEGEEWKKK